MKINNFSKGILSSSIGSFYWGFIGTIFFQFISFVGTLEVVIHRCIWTTFFLLITTTFFNKWNVFFKIIKNKKILIILFFTGILIFGNWSLWIYAVATNRIIDASIGYFIFPIISVLFGYIFLKEKLTNKRIISILLVVISLVYLLVVFNEIPWIGLSVAIMWSLYNLIRKKINIDADIGLLIESIFLLPIVVIIFNYLSINNSIDFSLSDPKLMFLLFLAGPMTVIPLFLFIKGVEYSGLGPSGMTFFITPTGQFLLGFFYYNEPFSLEKFLSFILIWIAVFIYLKDLYEKY
jgi:chloramphenicol-sensitive protein RarD